MAYRHLTKKPFEFTNIWLCPEERMDTEKYECYYYSYEQFCVEADKAQEDARVLEWNLLVPYTLVRKYKFQSIRVDKFIHYRIDFAHRHPKHWE